MAGESTRFSATVHPWLCDAMGHLSVRYYGVIFDDAAYRLFLELDGSPRQMQENGVGWADVRHVTEYRREILAGSVVEVRSVVQRVGTKSIEHFHELHDLQTGELCATLLAVSVRFDLAQRAAAPISEDVRARAARYIV